MTNLPRGDDSSFLECCPGGGIPPLTKIRLLEQKIVNFLNFIDFVLEKIFVYSNHVLIASTTCVAFVCIVLDASQGKLDAWISIRTFKTNSTLLYA